MAPRIHSIATAISPGGGKVFKENTALQRVIREGKGWIIFLLKQQTLRSLSEVQTFIIASGTGQYFHLRRGCRNGILINFDPIFLLAHSLQALH